MTPDLVTPRFSDMINFPQKYEINGIKDPDLETPRFSDRKTFPPRMSLNRGPTVYILLLYTGYTVRSVSVSETKPSCSGQELISSRGY